MDTAPPAQPLLIWHIIICHQYYQPPFLVSRFPSTLSVCCHHWLIKILLSCYWNVGWVGVQLPSTLHKVGIHWKPVWAKSQESGPIFHLECDLPNWSVLFKVWFWFCSVVGFFFFCPTKSSVSTRLMLFSFRFMQLNLEVELHEYRLDSVAHTDTWCHLRNHDISDTLTGLTYLPWDL